MSEVMQNPGPEKTDDFASELERVRSSVPNVAMHLVVEYAGSGANTDSSGESEAVIINRNILALAGFLNNENANPANVEEFGFTNESTQQIAILAKLTLDSGVTPDMLREGLERARSRSETNEDKYEFTYKKDDEETVVLDAEIADKFTEAYDAHYRKEYEDYLHSNA